MKNQVNENQNSGGVTDESPRPAPKGFVFRPDAARFLRRLADHVNSIVDGKRVKVIVDIHTEK